jgi:hypothetical protein
MEFLLHNIKAFLDVILLILLVFHAQETCKSTTHNLARSAPLKVDHDILTLPQRPNFHHNGTIATDKNEW